MPFIKKLVQFLGVVLMLVVFALVNQHVRRKYDLDAGWKVQADDVTIKIRDEGNLVTGHNTIGIDEDELVAKGNIPLLPFSLLAQWDYDAKTHPPCPDKIMAFNGKRVKVVGFMYPLQSGEKIKNFCLLRTTQTCCYGPRPQWSQYLLTETDVPVPFIRFAPIVVTGKFVVDPNPDEGYVYRLDSAVVVVADQ